MSNKIDMISEMFDTAGGDVIAITVTHSANGNYHFTLSVNDSLRHISVALLGEDKRPHKSYIKSKRK